MKKLLTKTGFLLAILFVMVGLFVSACEGPAGPAGVDGKDGKDADASCGKCHNDAADDVNLKFAQYDLSKHNKGIVYEEEAGRIGCAGCHTGDGFAEAAKLGQDDAVSKATSKINCAACHPIHTKYDSTDFSLRITAGFALRHTKAAIDQKTGNICSKCHQARAYTRTVPDTVSPASSTASYSRFGPHYGTPANVITENGLYKIAGSTAYPTSVNKHATLPKGCVSCHMGSDATNPAVGGHSFLMPVANLANRTDCYDCHDKAKLTARANYKDMQAKLVTYRQKLIEKGFIDTTQAVTAEGYQILGEYFATPGGKKRVFTNPTDVEVTLNYLYVAKDRSFGVHNPAFVKAIVENGLEYLSK